jgi:hypothetical protein
VRPTKVKVVTVAEHKPHAANVAGAFYVEDGCCTMCEVPFAEAPELFGTSKSFMLELIAVFISPLRSYCFAGG